MNLNYKIFILNLLFLIVSVAARNDNNFHKDGKLKNRFIYSSRVSSDPVSFIQTTIPEKVALCLTNKWDLMKCLKIFVLQRMENSVTYQNSGNVTADFIAQLINKSPYESNNDIVNNMAMDDNELDQRLLKSFQRFFYGREIQLRFLNKFLIRITPSVANKFDVDIDIEKRRTPKKKGGGRKPYNYLVNFGVPVLMMPAIILGSFLPMLIPAFKMATLLTLLINKGALLAALMYFAKSTALNHNQQQSIFYSSPYQ